LVAALLYVTVKEPERKTTPSNNISGVEESTINTVEETRCHRFGTILKPFMAPSLILAVLAGSIRNAAGYVFAYNTQPYFIGIGETKEDIAKYMGWIPIVGGTFSVAVGGFISDRLVKGRGVYARVAVVIVSLVSSEDCLHNKVNCVKQ